MLKQSNERRKHFGTNQNLNGKLNRKRKYKRTTNLYPSVPSRCFRCCSAGPAGQARSSLECSLSPCYVWYVGRSGPKDNVPSIFTSPWMSPASARTNTAVRAGPPTRGAAVSSLLIFVTPSKLRSTKDETRPPLPARVTPRTPMARGAIAALPSPHLSLRALHPSGLWTMSHSGGFWRDQRSHLTSGLTSCLTGGCTGGEGSAARLLTVRWECVGFDRGMVLQLLADELSRHLQLSPNDFDWATKQTPKIGNRKWIKLGVSSPWNKCWVLFLHSSVWFVFDTSVL